MLPKLASKINYATGAARWRIRRLAVRPTDLYRFRLGDGLLFDYPFSSMLAQYLFNPVPFEAHELDFVKRYLKLGMNFFDVGANGGLYTLIAARRVGATGIVHAFEPGPEAFELLRHNVQLNDLGNVKANQVAISDNDGTAQFAICSDGALSSFSQNTLPQQVIKSWVDVTTRTLDTYVIGNDLKHVDMIKIDVEGAETLVLKGCEKMLRILHQPPTILCEFSDITLRAMGTSSAELWQCFERLGYKLHKYVPAQKRLRPAVQQEWYQYENLIALADTNNLKMP